MSRFLEIERSGIISEGFPVRQANEEKIWLIARVKKLEEALGLIPIIIKKYNINHFGKCNVRNKLPCSCGRDEIIMKLKALKEDE